MFLWLIALQLMESTGPLARHYDVKQNAPRFDGVLLDLIIDYLTYVFIPAFALFKSGLCRVGRGGLQSSLLPLPQPYTLRRQHENERQQL